MFLIVKSLIQKHIDETGSERGKKILADWNNSIKYFKKIIPNDYAKVLKEIAVAEASGMNHDDALLEAFQKVTA